METHALVALFATALLPVPEAETGFGHVFVGIDVGFVVGAIRYTMGFRYCPSSFFRLYSLRFNKTKDRGS